MDMPKMSSCCHQQQQKSLQLSERCFVVRNNIHFKRHGSKTTLRRETNCHDGHALRCNYRNYATKTKFRGTSAKRPSKFYIPNSILMSQKSSASRWRRVTERSSIGPNPNCTGYSSRDNNCIYANLAQRNILSCILICLLLHIFLIGSVSSQTTVTNGCPKRCLCVFGEDNHQLMNVLLEDERQIGAWERIKTQPGPVNTYFCTRSGYSNVPKGLSVAAEALFLDGNHISTLGLPDFESNTNDVKMTSPTAVLSLANNSIYSISNDAFSPLTNLGLLILRQNSIRDLKWTTGSAVNRKLTELDLSLNKIKHFGLGGVGFFPMLERLDLSGNEILSVDGNVLANFPKLKNLDLSSNQITSGGLTASNTFFYSLTSLSVSNNDIKLVSSDMEFFTKFAQLRVLDVSKNKFSQDVVSSKTFSGFDDLRELNLSSCGIQKLEQGWLNGGPEKNLKTLDLSRNLLPSISSHTLSAVFTLDLNVTPSRGELEVTSQSSTLDRATIDFLDIPKENVEPHWLRPLQSLVVLHLEGNRRLFKIEDDTFDFLPNLQFLFLQNCAIRRLNIASARYRYGALPIATTLPKLSHIWIHGNPLECDCYIRFLKDWSITALTVNGNQSKEKHIDPSSYIMDSHTKQIQVEMSVCVSPINMAGLAIVNAQGQGMTCQDEPYSIFIAVLIGPLTFAGSVLLTMICGSFHVCFVKMKKGAVLSYHAREEMMRNPKVRGRRRNVPPNIFGNFKWTTPASQDDISTYSPGNRSGRYTNLVLGQLGEHRSQATVSAGILPTAIAFTHSTTSLTVEDAPSSKRSADRSGRDAAGNRERTGAPLLLVGEAGVKENRYLHDKSINNESGNRQDSIQTRIASRDIPFVDEGDQHTRTHRQNRDSENGHYRSFSETEEKRRLSADKREHSLPTLSSSELKDGMTSSSDSSLHKPVSIHPIPNASSSSHDSSEEVCL